MESFTKQTGLVMPLNRANVDTDQIIPAVFLKRIERTGFGQFLFNTWRMKPDGTPNPEFILNFPRYQGVTVLIAGPNFGCGSSREHAPWALLDYGFRMIVASSFAEIFHKNCFDNGIVPVLLPESQVRQLMEVAENNPGYQITVDLEMCRISDSIGFNEPFTVHSNPEVHAFRRDCLMKGLDDIGLTLQYEAEIASYEGLHRR